MAYTLNGITYQDGQNSAPAAGTASQPSSNTYGQVQQGQNFYQNGQNVGTVQYDSKTGRKLGQGEYTTIDAGNIGSTYPLIVQPKPIGTASAGLEGDITAQAEQYGQSVVDQKEMDRLKAEKNTSSTAIQDLYTQLGLQGQATEDVYKDEGVDVAKKEATDLNNQILAEQRALKNQQDAIYGATGVTREQADQKFREVQRLSISKQADLAVIQSAAQNRYSDAKAIADRKIEMQFEPMKLKLDALKFFYTENKDSLTKAEDRQFQATISERSRLLDDEKNKAKTLQDTKLALLQSAASQGAPASVLTAIQTAQTPESIVTAAGKYSGDILDRSIKSAQLNKLNAEAEALRVPQITNPDAGQYSGVLSTILGSSKFTKEQKAAVINAVNTGDDPFTVVKNQAKNIAGQTEATKITNYEVAASQLDDVQSLLNSYYAKGGKTNIFSGNYEKVVNKLGEVQNPELVEIATQIASALQIYRNAVSGTAYSVQEGKDIASIFPGINKSQGLNTAILNGRKRAFQSTIDGSYRSVLGNTYDTLKKAQSNKTSNNDPLGLGLNLNPLGI